MIDTGFKDMNKQKILTGSIVRSRTGDVYTVVFDKDLGYCLMEIIKKTIEKINSYCEEHLEILIQCLDRVRIL